MLRDVMQVSSSVTYLRIRTMDVSSTLSTQTYLHYVVVMYIIKLLCRVSEASSSALVRNCLVEAGSTTETYELKLGVNEDQLEVHLKFVEGRPEVVQLKKDDSRILMVDVMCLNQYVPILCDVLAVITLLVLSSSEHDMRLQLSGFKIIPADDPIIHDVLSHISMSTSSPNTISLVPLGTDKELSLIHI